MLESHLVLKGFVLLSSIAYLEKFWQVAVLWYDENTGKDKKDEQLTWDSYYSHLQDLSQANSHKETYFHNPHRGLKSGEENTISLEVPLTQLIIKGDLYIAA